MTLLEAARWSPSASNVQPWRFAYGLRGDGAFEKLAMALANGNRIWAQHAAALILVGSQRFRANSDGDMVPHATHAFDAGAAWAHLALQAHLKGLIAHAMGGFDHEKARLAMNVAETIDLHCVVAVGVHGPLSALPENLQAREKASDRKPLAQIASHGHMPE